MKIVTKKTQKPDFTLILPCYNEGEHFKESIEEIIQTLNLSKYTYEIVLLDDKSTDNTQKLIREIVKKYKFIKAFFHKKNLGRGAMVTDGIRRAKADIVGFIDFDLEVSPVYIPKMVSVIKNNEAEMVIGRRYYVFHPLNPDDLLREIASRIYIIIARKYLGTPFKDTEAGYKFFNKAKILPILKKVKDKHWFWDTEITARSYFSGLTIKEIPVLFLRRWDKTSTVKLIPDSIRHLKALIEFKKSQKTRKEDISFKEIPLAETIKDIQFSPQYCWDKNYIFWTAKTTPPRGKRVTKILQDYFDEKAKILDVGSSQGLTFGYLAQVFPNIVGIDIDQEAIKVAENRLKRLGLKKKIIYYHGDKFPFKDNSFNGVVSSEVFEHVANQQNFIREIARVLKKNGRLIITAPNKLYPVECEFHLPFLSYLPKRIADFYVKVSGKGESYDQINHPTYNQFKKDVGRYFNIEDLTLKVVKNYDKYYLQEERGKIAVAASYLIRVIEKIPFRSISNLGINIFTQLSPGWIFLGTKK